MYICVYVFKMKETINLRVSDIEIWENLEAGNGGGNCSYILIKIKE